MKLQHLYGKVTLKQIRVSQIVSQDNLKEILKA